VVKKNKTKKADTNFIRQEGPCFPIRQLFLTVVSQRRKCRKPGACLLAAQDVRSKLRGGKLGLIKLQSKWDCNFMGLVKLGLVKGVVFAYALKVGHPHSSSLSTKQHQYLQQHLVVFVSSTDNKKWREK
jgi:hypothetical protein